MSEEMIAQLKYLRSDFESVTGAPFVHFHCPILGVDEPTELCLGHVVNKQLPSSTRKCVVQRHDVDDFYGSAFEEDFQDSIILHGKTIHDILFDSDLRRRIRITCLLDGAEVGFYEYRGHIAPGHSRLTLEHGDHVLHLVIKALHLTELRSNEPGKRRNCSFLVSGDYRIAALASLIKAAHLTQFRLLGYRYANSAAGKYVGQEILGQFYLQNKGKKWDEVKKAALPFFRDYKTMMRPLAATDGPFTGTVDDNQILVCLGRNGNAFATGVFIRTINLVHMVLLPSFTSDDGVRQYADFMNNSDEFFETKLLLLDKQAGCWRVGLSDKREPRMSVR